MITLLFAMIFSVTTYTDDWHDADRNRTIPVRLFLPVEDSAKPFPTVLLSHGLGGNRDGFGYLGEDWSKHGYLVVVMQHPGSDSTLRAERRPGETLLQAMAKAASAEEAQHRADDVKFVLDELERRNKTDEKLKGKIDSDHIGIAGHSFGAQTAIAAVGRLPYKADQRIKAAIAMSLSAPKNVSPVFVHKNIKTPVLHLTGTKDTSPIQKEYKPEYRRISYDCISAPDQYLMIFTDGNHMLFSGHRRPFGMTELEKKYQPIITEAARQFLDAYVKDDAEAKKNLRNVLGELMRDSGSFEAK